MRARLKQLCIILIVAWVGVIMPTRAMAYEVLECTAFGTVKVTPDEGPTKLFFDDPYDPANPDTEYSFCGQTGADRIFSNVICSYVNILNHVLGKVYCGLQYTLREYVAIVISVYILIFGIQILMGVTSLSAGEILVRFAKIGVVWTFVSQANWGVDLLFIFFIDFANQAIWWTLGSIRDSGGNSISALMNMPDYSEGISGTIPVYVYIDSLIYNVISGPFIEANSKLIAFFAVLAYMVPPIFMIAAYWLWTTFTILVRTLISFMMCISAIAFLICLSPIFFCFILFQATMQFFETWLKFMMSFSLQVLVVFGCVAMWIMATSNFIGFFNQLSDVIFVDQNLKLIGATASGDKSVGICPYLIEQDTYLFGPNVRCEDENFNPYAGGSEPTKQALRDRCLMIDMSNLAPTKPEEAKEHFTKCQSTMSSDDTKAALKELSYFVVYHLMTLIIIAYTFDALLKQAPYIAKELAGPQYVPMLGQGFKGLGYGPLKGLSKISGDKKPGPLETLPGGDKARAAGGILGEAMSQFNAMSTAGRNKPIGLK